MICPECKGYSVYVVDTMHGEDGYVYRRRQCIDCNAKFHTIEMSIGDNEVFKKGYSDAYDLKTNRRFRKGHK